MSEEPEPAAGTFRAEVREWLRAHVPATPLPSVDTAEGFERHRSWERELAEARLSVISWPADYGGRGATLLEWLAFEDEYYAASAPVRVGQNGIFLLGPTLLSHGSSEQQARLLPPMARADEIWAQAWSEPDAGSDLAAIRARAARADGGWVLSGTKTWSSRAAFADKAFGLFRCDPQAERHRGLIYLMFSLHGDGVTVRPIRQLGGGTGFAEIFLDEVFVPDADVIGEPGDGWRIAMSTAGHERGLSLRSPGRFTAAADRLAALWRRTTGPARTTDPAATTGQADTTRPAGISGAADAAYPAGATGPAGTATADRVADAWIAARAYRLHTYATAARLAAGGTLGAEASLGKVFWSELDVALHETALDLLGPQAEVAGAGGPDGRWLDGYLFALAGPIYAGTNEIQRTVIAERLLGLPR